MSDPVYATKADLTALALSSTALTGVQDSDIDRALAAASRLADSYLGNRFTLPLTVWGDDLRQQICAVAAYRIMAARGYSPESGDAPELRDAFKDALAWLKDVSMGKATPIGVKDSDADGENNTDAAGNVARNAPFVVSGSQGDVATGVSFWKGDGTDSGGGKRGW